jgi:hypothetical protein
MKKILLPLVLIPLLLTGCAGGGYYGYSGPAYYDGPDVGIAFVGGGYYHHYHHYDSYNSTAYVGTHTSYHSTAHFAAVSSSAHASHVSHGASVSSGTAHFGDSHRH